MNVTATIDGDDVQVRFLRHGAAVPPDVWGLTADAAGRSALDALRRLEAGGQAVLDDSGALLLPPGVAALAPAEAAALGLPKAAPVVLSLSMRQPFPGDLESAWLRPNGQPVLGAVRRGAFLRIGDADWRLPEPLFSIAKRVQDYIDAPRDDPDERMRRYVILKNVLPDTPDSMVAASGLLLPMKIRYAESFSLDAAGSGLDPLPVPVLHAAAAAADDAAEEGSAVAPLLPPAQQDAFAAQQFRKTPRARACYPLGGGWYVALSPPLREALQVVRDMQDAPAAQRRDFLRNPRPWLKDRLGANDDTTLVETLFRETANYSARVIGLGLWQPRVVPWLKRKGTDWFGPPEFGLDVGGKRVTIPPAALPDLPERLDAAMAAGVPSITVSAAGGEQIPATAETRAAVVALRADLPGTATPEASRDAPVPRQENQVLVIEPNEQTAGFERGFVRRAPPLPGSLPACLATVPKPHQTEGIAWLRDAWNAGRPGVLLADDMGLGKTLQCLAFLALVREAMQAGRLPRKPLLVVAPVGLLNTWMAEHNQHLAGSGLGAVRHAYGPGLAQLRRPATSPGQPRVLDRAALDGADWVLTTYETLRDGIVDFGAVAFACAVFDEAQRIKTPAARVTDAAKSVNADFTLALTGTPVENRLADLWCIIDAVQPGHLLDLKSFSATYENAPDTAKLTALKAELERTTPATPAIMLRRMKADRLPGLPEKTEQQRRRPMPPVQAEAYRAALAAARADPSPANRLRALARLRAMSLHPDPAAANDDAALIAASARLAACCDILDMVAERREKALVFLEDLDFQARLAGVFQRRYGLTRAPLIISGEVAGPRRQERVDVFQTAPAGFDLMLLTPRAAGVGLTLTAANHVIHLSRWWNPAVEDQCTDRVHRIGQTRPVTVHVPLALLAEAEDRSFDGNLHALLTRKRELAAGLLAAPGATAEDEAALLRTTVGT